MGRQKKIDMKRVALLFAALTVLFTATAQEIRKSTHLFAIKDGQELYLDNDIACYIGEDTPF